MAEIALVVKDLWQGLGLGSIEELLRAAEERGIRALRADALSASHDRNMCADQQG